AYTTADIELGRLSEARTNQRGAGDQTYHDITAAVVELGQALPGQLSDPGLAGAARAVAELTASTHALALQRDLVRGVLTRGTYTAADQAGLADLAAVERERREAFLRAADAPSRAAYEHLWRGPDVEATQRIRDTALAGGSAVLSNDADLWYVAATHAIR